MIISHGTPIRSADPYVMMPTGADWERGKSFSAVW
jgi:hypothetical protein